MRRSARPSSQQPTDTTRRRSHPRLVAPPESLQELGERAGGAGHMLWFGEQAEEHEHGLALEAADTGPASPAPPHLSRKSSPHRRQTHAQTAPPALSQTFL